MISPTSPGLIVKMEDLLHLVMNTHGPLGTLADQWTIKSDYGRQQFAKLFHTTNENKITTLEDTWFKIQMFVFTNLYKWFLASDTELVNNYSYSAVRARIENDSQEKGNRVNDFYTVPCASYKKASPLKIVISSG
jgi:hypothetical protein